MPYTAIAIVHPNNAAHTPYLVGTNTPIEDPVTNAQDAIAPDVMIIIIAL